MNIYAIYRVAHAHPAMVMVCAPSVDLWWLWVGAIDG